MCTRCTIHAEICIEALWLCAVQQREGGMGGSRVLLALLAGYNGAAVFSLHSPRFCFYLCCDAYDAVSAVRHSAVLLGSKGVAVQRCGAPLLALDQCSLCLQRNNGWRIAGGTAQSLTCCCRSAPLSWRRVRPCIIVITSTHLRALHVCVCVSFSLTGTIADGCRFRRHKASQCCLLMWLSSQCWLTGQRLGLCSRCSLCDALVGVVDLQLS